MRKVSVLKTKKGFTLIELVLVISIGLFMTFLSFQNMLKEQENSQAKNAGEQIKQIANAANLYITNHYDTISSMTNSTGTVLDPGPRTCLVSSLTCTITIKTLMNEGYLPSNYSEQNVFRAGYNIILKRSGTSPYYNINGMLITDKSLTIGNNIRYDILGKAMQSAGIDSGMTKTISSIEGYNGSWNNNSTDYSTINKQGLLGYQLGYGSNSYSVFLRRDGTLPMTGDLNMGNNNINNAKNITANETIQGKVLRSDSYVEGKNGGGDMFRIGGSDANDVEFALFTANKPLTVWRNGGASNEQRFNVLGSQNIVGDLSLQAGPDGATTGQIKTSGNITSSSIVYGNYISPTSTAVVNTACAQTGLISKDSTGKILSCQKGLWKASSDLPSGVPVPWPTSTPPTGWLICNGQSFNTAIYTELAKAYPTGVLPDLRGVFIRGVDNGRGLDSGRAIGSYQDDALQKITGSFPIANRWRGYINGSFYSIGNWNTNYKNGNSDDWGKQVNFDSSRTTRSANETRPKNVAFNYIVKAE